MRYACGLRKRFLATVIAIVAAAAVAPAAAAATFVVNTTNDPGVGSCDAAECTLREAINAANASPGHDLIAFNIPGPPPHSIKPVTPLPPSTGPVTIDGTTEPDFAGSPIVEIDGTLAGPGNGLTIAGGNSTVRGLVINRFKSAVTSFGNGIELNTGGGNVVEGNYIGTDVTGTLPLPNAGDGVQINSSPNNLIGGASHSARNVISGNARHGVFIRFGASTGNRVQGNFIGTDVTGTQDVGNGNEGVVTNLASNNLIGGTSPAVRNVLSGNDAAGAHVGGNTDNQIIGNYIGTDVTGTQPLGNSNGVILDGSNFNVAGTVVSRNVISANHFSGILILGSGARDIPVTGNLVGTDATGTQPLGNRFQGIYLFLSASRIQIGGAGVGEPNVIAFNGGIGVLVDSGANNPILSNSIHSNGGLGIDLTPFGVTPNDPGDADTGSNELQNFPVLTAASGSGGSTSVDGTLNSQPNTTYRLEFFSSAACDPSGFGEGQTFLAARHVTTDATGNASFSFTFGSAAGAVITSTATDPLDNTSEFSNCVTRPGPGPPATLVLDPKAAVNPVDSEHCVTATVRDAAGNPVPGVTVRFQVTGSVTTSGQATTDAEGEASFCYQGPALPGADTIHAFADTDGDAVQDPGEPFDDATKTWVLPPSTPGCEISITNGGWIIATNGDRASFGGNAKADADGNVSGQQEYQDHGPAQPFTLHGNVLVVVCDPSGSSGTIFGQARIDGAGSHTYRIDVRDLGEPGAGSDTYRLRVNAYDSGEQVLQGGNVQIQKD